MFEHCTPQSPASHQFLGADSKALGDHAFSIAATRWWNVLSGSIIDCKSIGALKKSLKTHLLKSVCNLFSCVYCYVKCLRTACRFWHYIPYYNFPSLINSNIGLAQPNALPYNVGYVLEYNSIQFNSISTSSSQNYLDFEVKYSQASLNRPTIATTFGVPFREGVGLGS